MAHYGQTVSAEHSIDIYQCPI